MSMTPIDGHTRLVGLIGWPVEHSMSPAMHNAAFQHIGLNWRYVPLPVPPDQVQVAIRGLGALGFRGANVTVPHKRAAQLALARLVSPDVLDPDAQALGAVNTITVERTEHAEGEITFSGHNTDVAGFLGALRDGSFRPRGTSAVVVGAGGAARAVVFGLMRAGSKEVVVLNRTPERAEALALDLRPASRKAHQPAVRALPLAQETLIEAARTAHLLVNATPLGMWPHVDRSIWPEGVPIPSHLTVFDLIYNPLETKLQRQAHASGARALNGLRMLVRQGALAFEMWTGKQPPMPAMRQACERALHNGPPA